MVYHEVGIFELMDPINFPGLLRLRAWPRKQEIVIQIACKVLILQIPPLRDQFGVSFLRNISMDSEIIRIVEHVLGRALFPIETSGINLSLLGHGLFVYGSSCLFWKIKNNFPKTICLRTYGKHFQRKQNQYQLLQLLYQVLL